MILFLDTSALVKLYVEEPHSERVREATFAAEQLWISVVAYAEARAALARRRREGAISVEGHALIVARLRVDWRELFQVVVDPDLAHAAGILADRHALRGFDAVHLASALQVQIAEGPVTMATYDKALKKAAAAEGLALV